MDTKLAERQETESWSMNVFRAGGRFAVQFLRAGYWDACIC